jgi:chromosome partitioning protein
MRGMTESCSICGAVFDVQFRYQMEEKDGGFSFFCSQACLEKSQATGGDGMAECGACSKRFRVELVSNVLYVKGQRKYACSMACRAQLAREAAGVRLGEIAASDVPNEAVAAADGASHLPPSQGPRVLAVFNHKGGTGKTTTSVSIAAGLAMRQKKVLIVDTDAQGNVGVSLRVAATPSLYHVLVMGLDVQQAVTHVREGLDLLPSNESLAAAELYLAGRQNRDRVLKNRLAQAAQAYDYVILDCSPSLSLMNQNALVFADSLLVPVACDYLSLVGVRQVIRTVKQVNQILHHPVQIWGVLPTFYDSRARICREALETMRGHFGSRCLQPIRAAMKVKEAPSQGQTIFEYAAGSNAAQDYLAVVDRVLGVGIEEAAPAELSA